MPSAHPFALVIALALAFTARGCDGGDGATGVVHLTPAQRATCALRGKPITLGRMVRVFRAHGISLSIDEPNCFKTEKQRADAALTDASNFGPTGLIASKPIRREQGDILCRVALNASAKHRHVVVTKYPTDTETYVSVWNVDCAVYPSDQASEKRQVERVRRAMVALAAIVGNGRR